MHRYKRVDVLLSLCGFLFVGNLCEQDNCAAERDRSETVVTVTLGSLRITSAMIELRCEVKNNTAQDVWVYAKRPGEYEGRTISGSDGYFSLEEEGPTLFIFGRANQHWRQRGVWGHTCSPYARLPAGQSQAEVLLFLLPIPFERAHQSGLIAAMQRNVEYITRVALEFGYYTAEDLNSLTESLRSYQRINFDETGDRVFITDSTQGELVNAERAVRVLIDGVFIPCAQWLYYETGTDAAPAPRGRLLPSLTRVFHENMQILPVDEFRYAQRLFVLDQNLLDGAARQIADIYIELVEGRLNPAELTDRLDKVLSMSDRKELLEKLQLKQMAASVPHPRITPIQALEDLFSSFLLDCQQYRCAKQLFSVDDDLFDESARQMADAYVRVAEGKLDPSELARHLDNILNESDREKLLQELQKRQMAAEQKKEAKVADLIAEARRRDNPTAGREALALLREVLTIDPHQNEALGLMEKISAYYRGDTTTNSIGMQLAWVPAGTFLMGAKKELGDSPAPHEVRISRGFWMGVREVTQAEYETIMAANPRAPTRNALPVNRISWYDATEFCQRLSEKEGSTYRLPTEAEWEYACRAGTNSDFWWGDDAKADPGTPNAFGLYDMHTNMGEWCQDWTSITYHTWVEIDPQGPPGPELQRTRVVRGSAKPGWVRDGKCPCSLRQAMAPELKDDFVGLRVVLEDH